ncbi:DEAD/DEAH box helicase [Exiguobacterium flavidum]|uniref:DEAD/DEAH box helicase n=1 Tax=Exiguobacterium flavidum TaxID=2184695 RepID=UPI0018E55455|nr:DEAD/DEAH box helicase [Exiguobacterium flavidum]
MLRGRLVRHTGPHPGLIRFKAVTWRCRRCGGLPTPAPCTCGPFCRYCRHCLALGVLRSCDTLATDPRPLDPPKPARLIPKELTPAQERISSRIEQAIATGSRLLVHAVCGAGKTPMLDRGIETSLRLGKRVLVAAPRTDVVRELARHFEAAFPDADIKVLYGGSSDRLQVGDITISTTHQLFHYYRCFDTVIVDEIDAFPYRFDYRLRRAVRRAAKPGASRILLSATPARLDRLLPVVTLSRRYHGFPLPVPRLHLGYRFDDVKAFILDHPDAPRLLFVPRVSQLDVWQRKLAEVGITAETVHAADPARAEKVERFRTSRGILLATTILERGVTIKNVQVAVCEADRFTESALIQIAGRAGRSTDHPDGDVVFFADDRTNALYGSIDAIKRANRG